MTTPEQPQESIDLHKQQWAKWCADQTDKRNMDSIRQEVQSYPQQKHILFTSAQHELGLIEAQGKVCGYETQIQEQQKKLTPMLEKLAEEYKHLCATNPYLYQYIIMRIRTLGGMYGIIDGYAKEHPSTPVVPPATKAEVSGISKEMQEMLNIEAKLNEDRPE